MNSIDKNDLSYSKIYAEVRNEINSSLQFIWTLRKWSVLLFGCISALVFRLFTTPYPCKCVINDPKIVVSIIIFFGALLNLLLHRISWIIAERIVKSGTYLFFLEKENSLNKGWEHWIFLRNYYKFANTKERIKSDITNWISILYFLFTITLALFFQDISLCILIIIMFLFLLYSFLKIINFRKCRQKAMKEIFENFKDNVDWDLLIEKYIHPEKPEKNG